MLVIKICLFHIASQHVVRIDRASRKRLTLDRTLDNALFARRRDLAITVLDILDLPNGRRGLNLPLGHIGAVYRIIGNHRLCHADRATRHQGDTGSGGGKLCSGHFDRHRIKPCCLRWLNAAHPHFHQLRQSLNDLNGKAATALTMNRCAKAPESGQFRCISGVLSRFDTENAPVVSHLVRFSLSHPRQTGSTGSYRFAQAASFRGAPTRHH